MPYDTSLFSQFAVLTMGIASALDFIRENDTIGSYEEYANLS